MKKNISHIKSLKKQAGWSLIETAIVLILVGGGIVYAISKYNESDESQTANQESTNLVRVAGNIKSKYSTAPDFSAVNTAVLRDQEIFPNEMVSGANVHSLFGGPIAVTPADASGTNDSFLLAVAGYSKKVCNKIVEKMDSNTYAIAVNGRLVKAANATLDRTALSSACVTGSNAVNFQFSRF